MWLRNLQPSSSLSATSSSRRKRNKPLLWTEDGRCARECVPGARPACQPAGAVPAHTRAHGYAEAPGAVSQKSPRVCLKRWIRQRKQRNHQRAPALSDCLFTGFLFPSVKQPPYFFLLPSPALPR